LARILPAKQTCFVQQAELFLQSYFCKAMSGSFVLIKSIGCDKGLTLIELIGGNKAISKRCPSPGKLIAY